MSHPGLSQSVPSVLLYSTCCCLILVVPSRVHAQALEQLSELLQAKQTQQNAADELPTPARPIQQNNAPPNKLPPGKKQPSGLDSTVVVPEDPAAPPRIYLGLEAEQAAEGIGVRVASVTRESPAWKAGFRVDDRILGINGFAIGNMDHMVEQLSKTRPGQSVNFLVNRDGRNRELIAVLMNADVADQIQNKPANLSNAPAWLGITSSDLSTSFREQFGIAAFRGAAVTQVVNGSPAYQAGIRPGDAVVEAGGRPVETAAELQRWVEQSRPGDQAQVVYYRGASRQSTKIVLVGDPQLQPPTQAQRPQAFPKNEITANRPTIPATKPPQPVPVDPTITPDPNTPLVLDPQPEIQLSEREKALEAEVVLLRKQLAEAQAKLAETKQQLDNILRALKD
jgi:membrane-associated protease RseP (regulator of RpoE activity)